MIQFIPNFPHSLSASKLTKISTNTSSNIHPKVSGYQVLLGKVLSTYEGVKVEQ